MSTSRKPTKRVVRRRSLVSKVLDYPSTVWMNIEGDITLLDLSSLGWPIGCALNALHFLIKLGELTVTAARRRNILGKAKQLSQADERLQQLKKVDRTGVSLVSSCSHSHNSS
jgi:hypothetical protein